MGSTAHKVTRNAAGKVVAKKFTLDRIKKASNEMAGFCLACGKKREGCEPDARKYHCEGCGLDLVYGTEEIALMGLVKGGGF